MDDLLAQGGVDRRDRVFIVEAEHGLTQGAQRVDQPVRRPGAGWSIGSGVSALPVDDGPARLCPERLVCSSDLGTSAEGNDLIEVKARGRSGNVNVKKRIQSSPDTDPAKGADTADAATGHHCSALVDVRFRKCVHSAAEGLKNAIAAGGVNHGRAHVSLEQGLPRGDISVAPNTLLDDSEALRYGTHPTIVVTSEVFSDTQSFWRGHISGIEGSGGGLDDERLPEDFRITGRTD
jgi:hypothetical protein